MAKNMTRKQMEERIRQIRVEMISAGPIHKKDLSRELMRLRKEINIYDGYQIQAKKKREVS